MFTIYATNVNQHVMPKLLVDGSHEWWWRVKILGQVFLMLSVRMHILF